LTSHPKQKTIIKMQNSTLTNFVSFFLSLVRGAGQSAKLISELNEKVAALESLNADLQEKLSAAIADDVADDAAIAQYKTEAEARDAKIADLSASLAEYTEQLSGLLAEYGPKDPVAPEENPSLAADVAVAIANSSDESQSGANPMISDAMVTVGTSEETPAEAVEAAASVLIES
jgi:hypothetical protein